MVLRGTIDAPVKYESVVSSLGNSEAVTGFYY